MRPGRVWVLAVSSLVLVAGCAPAVRLLPGSASAAPEGSGAAAEPDSGVRTVRMNSGSALTYVLPETAAQILCQILEKDRWEQVLEDRVGRRLSGAECQVAGERIGLSLRLSGGDGAFAPRTVIGGRPAAALRGDDEVGYRVALTAEALRSVPGRISLPLLDFTVTYGTGLEPPARRELAVRVLDEIVPRLAQVGDQLPGLDEQGRMDYVSTGLTRGGQIIDLPRPVQALQLCTLAVAQLGVAPAQVDVAGTGRCELGTGAGPVVLALQPAGAATTTTSTDRIAGRPARSATSSGAILVRLRDDAPVELSVSGPDSTRLAERLVPALLG